MRKALKKCLSTARVLVLEREYLRFISPDMEMFRKTELEIEKDNPEVIISGETSEESKQGEIVETQREVKLSIMKDSTIGDLSEYRSPYLFSKQMQRDYIVFEKFSLVILSKHE